MGSSARISRFVVVHLTVLLAHLCWTIPAAAYTTKTCQEQWFVPTPGKEFNGTSGVYDGSTGAFTLKNRQDKCDRHKIKVLGWRDYQETEGFAMVDGKGYFIKKHQAGLGPYCGMTGGSLDPGCLLPRPLRHYENQYYNDYYQVTDGEELKLIPLGKADLERMLRIDKDGFWDIPAYATEGQSVYFITPPSDGGNDDTVLRIDAAYARSFHRFVREGSQETYAWSADQSHVYFFGKAVSGMNPHQPLRLVGNENDLIYFMVNDDRVFQIRFNEARERSDMRSTLRIYQSGF